MNAVPFYCHFCSNKPSFSTKCNLNRHIKSKHGNSPSSFVCTECNLRFNRKDNLKRHIVDKHNSTDERPIFICAHCSKSFGHKSSLRDHIATLHSNQNIFKCAHCSEMFDRKSTLRKHIAAIHSNRNIFKCVHCSETFGCKSILRKHIATLHSDQNIFKCDRCSKTFRRKSIFRKHITALHSDQNIFKCTYCSKIFGYKSVLTKHIAALHLDRNILNKRNENYECYHCLSTFCRFSDLRRHIQKLHLEQRPERKVFRLKCLKCSNTFRTTKVLNKHYVDIHGVELNYQKLIFDCIESYEQWLENHQHQTLTRFVIWYKTKKADSHRLICHRSRHIRSSLVMDSRKRHLKTSGYKRLGGICPAEIRLQILEDGTCCVEYQKTHVGHNIGEESELGQIFLTNEEKRNIAAEIQSGIPLAQIVNRTRLSNSGENTNRLSMLTRRDVRNIAASQNLDFENCEYVEPGCDPIEAEVIIAEHENDILFYKRQTEEDSRFKLLKKEDFVLIIMTKDQETYLRSYGHKVICLDGTHYTNPFGFLLHTLMVLDTDYEGLTAAFLLSNLDDECVVDIFLTCIRDRVGILEPLTLMTGMQPSYRNSWIKIMKIPQYYLFCTWHVHEAWRQNFAKISNKMKRNVVRDELNRMLRELDPVKFENDLESFLSREDDDLAVFQDYFRESYSDKTQQWAYCYRLKAGINTNMNLETFHKSFKYNIARGQKIQSLTQCLAFIFEYLTLLKTNIVEKKVRGKITNKLQILRSRHKSMLKEYEKNGLSKVIVTDSDVYMVQSFTESDCFYTITKCELKECDREKTCRLFCDNCNLCFHAFSCTCVDSSIKSNMCKHIHLIGFYLKDKQPEFNANRLQLSNETDVPTNYMACDENSSPSITENQLYTVHQRVANVEVGDSNKKEELFQQMTYYWQEIVNKFSTITEGEAQQTCSKMERVLSAMD